MNHILLVAVLVSVAMGVGLQPQVVRAASKQHALQLPPLPLALALALALSLLHASISSGEAKGIVEFAHGRILVFLVVSVQPTNQGLCFAEA